MKAKYIYCYPNKTNAVGFVIRVPKREGGRTEVVHLFKAYSDQETAFQSALIDRNNIGFAEWSTEWKSKKQ